MFLVGIFKFDLDFKFFMEWELIDMFFMWMVNCVVFRIFLKEFGGGDFGFK